MVVLDEKQNLSELFEAAISAPLENFDVIHELLQFVIAIFWILAYGALLRKLRVEKTAIGLSFQMLFALLFAEANKTVLSVLAYIEFSSQLRSAHLIRSLITSLLSFITYIAVTRKFDSSYESERDSFGSHPLNLFGITKKRTVWSRPVILGIRRHWITLYIYAAVFGGFLQHFRRQKLSAWFGFWQCWVDCIEALALIPQLHMWRIKRNRAVNPLLGRFVLFVLYAKLSSLTYWVTDTWFHGLPQVTEGRGVHIATDALNVAILLNFVFHFLLIDRRYPFNICLPV